MPSISARRLPFLFACVLSAALVACGGGGPKRSPLAAPLSSQMTLISAVPLVVNSHGAWPVQDFVARTETEWSQIWDQPAPMGSPDPAEPAVVPEPTVDFSAYTVIGVSLGIGSNGCDGIEFLRITDEIVQIRAEYRRLVVLLETGGGHARRAGAPAGRLADRATGADPYLSAFENVRVFGTAHGLAPDLLAARALEVARPRRAGRPWPDAGPAASRPGCASGPRWRSPSSRGPTS